MSLKDLTDRLFYKKICNTSIGYLIRKKVAFTLTINTDGISLSETSTLCICGLCIFV